MKKLLLVLALMVAAGYLAVTGLGGGGKHASAITPPPSLDFPYKCYRASTAPGTQFERQLVTIADTWGTQAEKRWRVIGPLTICTHTEKLYVGGEAAGGGPETLVCYTIRSLGRNTFHEDDVPISNQFDQYSIDISNAVSLCVETQKIGINGKEAGIGTSLAYKCHTARDTDRTPVTFETLVEDQFDVKFAVISRIQQFCFPVLKEFDEAGVSTSAAPHPYLTCYAIRQLPFIVTGQAASSSFRLPIVNQFGYQELTVRNATQLCEPTFIN